MPLHPGLDSTVEIASVIVAISAVLCAAATMTAGRALARPARMTYRWLCAGVLGVALGVVLGATAVRQARTAQQVAVTIAISGVVAAVPLAIGLLGLLGPPTASRLRHAVDGLIVGACLFSVGWLIFVVTKPDAPTLGFTMRFLVIAGPAWVAASVTGIAAMTAAWATSPRGSAMLAAVGAVLVVGGGMAGVMVCCFPAAVSLATTALPVAVGCVSLAGAAWWAARVPHLEVPVPDRPPHPAYTIAAVCAVVAGGLFEVSTLGTLEPVGALTGCFIVLALVVRLTLALSDVQGYAEKLEENNREFEDLAHTDPLTRLGNRRQLMRILPADPSGTEGTLLTLDLDGFKNINDLQGHDVGDAVLVEVGRRLRSSVRPGDVPVRLGGDEFAVLAYTRPERAQHLAARLLAVLSRPYDVTDGPVYLSTSIGLAGCASAANVEELLRNADLALRFAKQGGKNRFEQYDQKYDAWLRRRIELEQGLRQAIKLDELSLSFQPVVSLPEGKPVGMEALLRWHHAKLGVVPPSEFIPVAEEIGRIGALGRWTVHAACRQLARWLADGHDLWLAINVSVRELRAPHYAEHVAEVLRAYRLPGSRLVLEVTEESVAKDADVLAAPLLALRELGVRVALDDFGAGYSSLGQLRSLPVDILKVDRALVADLVEGPGAGAPPLVDVVVQLAQRLGLSVVAEGVEDATQRAIVEAAGCDLGQGFLFGRAMPADRVSQLLAEAQGAVTGS